MLDEYGFELHEGNEFPLATTARARRDRLRFVQSGLDPVWDVDGDLGTSGKVSKVARRSVG